MVKPLFKGIMQGLHRLLMVKTLPFMGIMQGVLRASYGQNSALGDFTGIMWASYERVIKLYFRRNRSSWGG